MVFDVECLSEKVFFFVLFGLVGFLKIGDRVFYYYELHKVYIRQVTNGDPALLQIYDRLPFSCNPMKPKVAPLRCKVGRVLLLL